MFLNYVHSRVEIRQLLIANDHQSGLAGQMCSMDFLYLILESSTKQCLTGTVHGPIDWCLQLPRLL